MFLTFCRVVNWHWIKMPIFSLLLYHFPYVKPYIFAWGRLKPCKGQQRRKALPPILRSETRLALLHFPITWSLYGVFKDLLGKWILVRLPSLSRPQSSSLLGHVVLKRGPPPPFSFSFLPSPVLRMSTTTAFSSQYHLHRWCYIRKERKNNKIDLKYIFKK